MNVHCVIQGRLVPVKVSRVDGDGNVAVFPLCGQVQGGNRRSVDPAPHQCSGTLSHDSDEAVLQTAVRLGPPFQEYRNGLAAAEPEGG